MLKDIRSNSSNLYHPCHNQSTDRHLKLVTEAFSDVTGFRRKDGMIHQKIESLKLMKLFNRKSSWRELTFFEHNFLLVAIKLHFLLV